MEQVRSAVFQAANGCWHPELETSDPMEPHRALEQGNMPTSYLTLSRLAHQPVGHTLATFTSVLFCSVTLLYILTPEPRVDPREDASPASGSCSHL